MPPSAIIHHLLIVDDDLLVCELLTQLLQRSGFEVTAVTSAEAALALLADPALVSFDAVLTDLQMPGAGGLDVAHHVRALTLSPLLLGMSARLPSPQERQTFDEFLPKPFTLADLENALHQAASVRNSGTVGSNRGVTSESGTRKAQQLPEKGSSSLDTPAAESYNPFTMHLPALDKVLDLQIFSKLRATIGSAHLCQLYEMTANDVDSRLIRMRASLQAGNQLELRSEAHAIKGGCAMVGALELSRLASEAELGPESDLVHLQEMSEACVRLRQVVTIVPP